MGHTITAKLIEQAAEGDEAAFNEIYLSLRRPIYGFAYKMLRESALAEDITQETFIFFIEHPEKYQHERGTLLSFLCGYARNRIFHHLRKKQRQSEISQDETDDYFELKDEVSHSPLTVLLGHELTSKIEEGIARLPVSQREVIVLRGIKELSYEEMAQIVGVDVTVIKVRLYRARQNLVSRLAPYLAGEKEKSYEV